MDRFRLLRTHVKTTLAVATGAIAVAGWLSVNGFAFNPQPDPPGFGMVTLVASQGIRLNAYCSAHGAGHLPPGPCKATLMFHDMSGRALVVHDISIRPGQSVSVPFALSREDMGDPVGLVPCIMPAADSRGMLIPSVEVFSLETGRTMLQINAASAHLTDFAPARGTVDPPEPDIVGR